MKKHRPGKKRKTPSKTPPAPPQSRDGRWLAAVRILGGLGIGLSGYLLWISMTGDSIPGCGPDSGCDEVLHSRWASWFGVPVSLPAFLAYVAILTTSFRLGHSRAATPLREWIFLVWISVTILGAAAWFVGLQLFALEAICPYCMASHTCGTVMAVLLLLHAPFERRGQSPGRPDASRSINRLTARRLMGAGLAAVVILIGGQLLHAPKTFEVVGMENSGVQLSSSPSNAPVSRESTGSIDNEPPSSAAETPDEPMPRLLSLHDHAIQFDLNEVPILGSIAAPHMVVSLFDYTCPTCRGAHKSLVETQRLLSNELAIVNLVVPLDPACNHLVKRHMPDHTNACAHARIGLALWRSAPDQLPAYEDWFFEHPEPPTPEVARDHAMRLAGSNALTQALSDPWIDRQLELGIRLYHTNYLRFRKGKLPQLMVGTNLLSGYIPNPDRLAGFVAEQLGIDQTNRLSTVRP